MATKTLKKVDTTISKKNPNQVGFLFNQDNCIGCRSCEGACKQEYNLPVGVRRRQVVIQEGGKYPKPYRHYVSLACNHCADPACAKACPVGAYTKREKDGIVVHNQEKCIGCRRCEWACPYGAPQFDEELKKIDKCSLCAHRIDAGMLPACVQTCLGLALFYDKISEMDKNKAVVKSVEGFADPDLTNPSIRFIPAKK